MKLMIISIGLMIIFISTFFILFIGNALLKDMVTCTPDPEDPQKLTCRVGKYSMEMVISLVTILAFLVVDAGAVYLMLVSWAP